MLADFKEAMAYKVKEKAKDYVIKNESSDDEFSNSGEDERRKPVESEHEDLIKKLKLEVGRQEKMVKKMSTFQIESNKSMQDKIV